MIHLENNYKNFYFSFLIILITNLIHFYTDFINQDINRIIQTLIGFHIYLSIFFLIYKVELKNFFFKQNFLFLILILYCLFQFLRPPAENYEAIIQNYWLSKFGSIIYDTVFLLPLFYFWSH